MTKSDRKPTPPSQMKAASLPIIGVLIRNSTARQVGNYRSEAQYDMGPRIEARGCTVRYYDEQGTSGADLSKRRIAMQILDDLKSGAIQGIAAYDFKRLTRDEFGIDGATIARRIVEAHGRFHTFDREYNLRLDDDLLQFQFGCFLSGIDWRNIRNTLWSGIFRKLEQEPHVQKTPLGYMNVPDERGKNHLAKNPEQQHIIDALARAFDECDSLAQVVRRLNTQGPERPTFRGRGGTSTRWHMYGVRYILRNTIYTGMFSFGASLKQRSTVWDRYAIDPVTNKPKDFLQHCPELLYWEPARVRQWRRKFDRPQQSRVMSNGHTHLLAGVLDCISCGSRMTGHGEGKYACSAMGNGRGRAGLVCDAPQLLTESIVFQILRQELPSVLAEAQGLAGRLQAQISKREPSPAAQRLAFLDDRAKSITESMFDENTPDTAIKPLMAKLATVETEAAVLREQLVDEETARLHDEDLLAVVDQLSGDVLSLIDDHLSLEQQSRFYSALFAHVRIETLGFASGRKWRLQSYTARLSNEARVSEWAPWGKLPNPRSQPGSPRRLQFESPSGRMLAIDISERIYVDYEHSLRELAAILSAAAA